MTKREEQRRVTGDVAPQDWLNLSLSHGVYVTLESTSFLKPDSFIPLLHPAVTFWPEIKTFIWRSQQLEHVSDSSVKVIKTIATNDVCLKRLVSSLIKVPLASSKKEDLWCLYSSPPAGGVLHYFTCRSSNFLCLWNSRVAASLTGWGDEGTSTPDPLKKNVQRGRAKLTRHTRWNVY